MLAIGDAALKYGDAHAQLHPRACAPRVNHRKMFYIMNDRFVKDYLHGYDCVYSSPSSKVGLTSESTSTCDLTRGGRADCIRGRLS